MVRVGQIAVLIALVGGIVWHVGQQPQVYVATPSVVPIQLPQAAVLAVAAQPSSLISAPDFSQ